MNRKSIGKVVLYLSFLILILWIGKVAHSSLPHFDFDIQSHFLRIQIDPSRHRIKGEDRIEILFKEEEAQTFSFLLHSKLEITHVANLKTGKALHWAEISYSDRVKRLDISFKKGDSPLSLSVSYEGQIYDPVVKEKALQFVRGDQTTGLISPEGVYLSSSSYWYPDRPNSMATFAIEVTIAGPFRIVTQGELLSEEFGDGFWKSRWSYGLPTESLTLVAGKYSVKTRKVEGMKISTYFFPEDDRFSEFFLNAAEEYLNIYAELLGPYPYRKFDIVQNFFSSGYSFPTFTLLAPEAIRQGKEFLRPGALDHEIVHSWWGHSISGKPGTGNWAEALTTYCTNYYYKELKMGQEVARRHRQDVMQKYAIQVAPPKEYPLRQFEGKEDEAGGQIGYGKGSMVFHMLRQTVGRDLFFATLRNFARQYGGKQASWDDIRKSFEEKSGKRLDGFFSQWLDRPGGPQLRLENVGLKVTSKGYLISGEVVQEGEIYEIEAEVKVDIGERGRHLLLEISKRKNPFSIEVPKIPISLTVDPDHHIFRRLYAEEIIPCLNAFLEGGEKIFVIPDEGKGDAETQKIYTELVRMAKERKGGEILSVKEMTEEKVLGSSLMLFGDSWKDPLFSKLLSNLPSPVQLKNGTFLVNGESADEGDESLLLTYRDPLRSGKWVTIYFGRSAEALSRARYIFFYGWDSYILFKKGRVEKRGNFYSLSSSISCDFLSKDHLDLIQPQRLKEHISYLASEELAGRFPGALSYQKAQTYLIKRLEEMGISPIVQRFRTIVKDIEKADVVLRSSEKEEKIRGLPLKFSKEAEWKGPLGVKDISGKAVLLGDLDLSENRPEEALLEKIRELQSKGAQAILFLIREERLDRIAPYITYPSNFPPKLEERLRNKEREGYYVHRLIEASKVAVRAKEPDFHVSIPVLLVPYAPKDEEWAKSLVDRKDASIELSLRFKEVRLRDSNIGGIIHGQDPERKREFLVLGAHYDHLGKDERSGPYFSGADDNASGVAALLEIGRSLMMRKTDLRRSVVLIFFGGEEWGLKGSRYFVENPFIPLARIKAMLSLDSIGGAGDEKEVFLIGSSYYPNLAERNRKFLQRLGLREGRNIDRYAFTYGSDHYPFHQKGIPSLDYFASEYKRLHTLRDNLEGVHFDHLADVTRLIYLTAYEFLTEP